jgi:hypothetical protein
MESIEIINIGLLLGSALVVLGIGSSLIASRFGAPLLLVFLVIGMLAGEDGPGGLAFNDYRLTYFVGSLALAVILFDGGLRSNLAFFKGIIVPAGLLSTVGVTITAGLTGLFAVWLLNLQPLEGLLIGAMVASTDAAAVFFLLKAGGLHLRRRVGTTLEIESATNDPAAVFLTVVLVELVLAGARSPGWEVLATLGSQALVGAAVGVSGGLAIWWTLNRVTMPGGLHPLFVIASAVLIFGIAAVSQGSGFLAAYLAGLVVGNRPGEGIPLDPQLPRRCDVARAADDVYRARAPSHAEHAAPLCRPGPSDCSFPDLRWPTSGGLALPMAFPLFALGEAVHLVGWPSRGGLHLFGRCPDALGCSERGGLLQHRVLRRADLALGTRLDAHLDGQAGRCCSRGSGSGAASRGDRPSGPT